MRIASLIDWRGVFPAATTQLAADMAVDLEATRRVQSAPIDDGVHGLVLLGAVGENISREPEGKRAVVAGAREAVGGRAPHRRRVGDDHRARGGLRAGG